MKKDIDIKLKEMILKAKRYENNPIISPRPNNLWESNGTFNPTAFKIRNKIFIIYRQISKNNISTLGLAISKDGFNIDERLDYPIYIPRENFEIHPEFVNKINPNEKFNPKQVNWKYISGFSYFGVEDPRISIIDDKIYLLYTAYNGVSIPRGAISWIKIKDFLNEKWDKWSKPLLITHPDIPDKNIVLFPKKIKNKYLFFHRIFPYIWADYIESLEEFKHGRFLFGKPVIFTRPNKWDSRKIGAGATPIEIKEGWILVYHGVSGWDDYYYSQGLNPHIFHHDDGYKYKGGIMVLDRENPERVIFRPDYPILEPEEWYELHWPKPNIVYPTGAILEKEELLIYYGASDFFVALATLDLNDLLNELEKQKIGKKRKIEVGREIKRYKEVRKKEIRVIYKFLGKIKEILNKIVSILRKIIKI